MTICNKCNSPLSGNFCSQCGQPAQLKRINSHYIFHEIQHELHLEKGLLYTTRELLLRPAESIKLFLQEDRTKLLKPIIYVILTSLIYSVVNHYFHIEEQYMQHKGFENSTVSKILNWIQDHYGYANLLMGLFIAFWLKVFFRKYDYNYYEIIVMLCYVMGICMLLLTVSSLVEGIFHIKLFLYSGVVFYIYTVWVIGKFYDGTKFKNYIKAFFAYLLGSILFYMVAIIAGVLFDLINK